MTQQKTAKTVLNFKKIQQYLRATTALTMAALIASTVAYADPGVNETPTGFSLQAGSVNNPVLSGSNNKNMDIQQTSTRAVIDWNTFNIGQNAKVTFNQTQGSNSVVINRVTGGSVSQIFGTLKANGKVMILDPNGVFISQNSSIDVGGIIATTGTLDNANQTAFMNGGTFVLSNIDGISNASVINNATVSIKDSGLLAFVAPYVENNGTINAKLGKVTLASGKKVTVDFAGDELIQLAASDTVAQGLIKNSGTIKAQGGIVIMTAAVASNVVDTVVNMSGVVNATNFSTTNGKIVLSSGGGGKVSVSGTLDVSRNTAGDAGTISISGYDIDITSVAKLVASITKNNVTGNGGEVSVIADNSLVFSGTVENTAEAGNGGDTELSAGNSLSYFGLVNSSSETGTRGTLTLDPAVITISNSTTDPVVNIDALHDTLMYTNVHIIGGEEITLADDADLSDTVGDLILEAPTLNLLHDLTIGEGELIVDADTVNLAGNENNSGDDDQNGGDDGDNGDDDGNNGGGNDEDNDDDSDDGNNGGGNDEDNDDDSDDGNNGGGNDEDNDDDSDDDNNGGGNDEDNDDDSDDDSDDGNNGGGNDDTDDDTDDGNNGIGNDEDNDNEPDDGNNGIGNDDDHDNTDGNNDNSDDNDNGIGNDEDNDNDSDDGNNGIGNDDEGGEEPPSEEPPSEEPPSEETPFGGLILDDNLILKKLGNNSFKSGKASITVSNTPNGGGNGFFSLQDLANLEPAAGGDDANDLANIEPAAGGTGNGGHCWSNVGGGGVVNIDLSDDLHAMLSDQSSCGE